MKGTDTDADDFVDASRQYLQALIDKRFRLTRFCRPLDGELAGKIVGYVDYPNPGGYATSTVVIDPGVILGSADAAQVLKYVEWCVLVANEDLQEYIESPEYEEACQK